VELAAYYDQEGADELVFLDISASHEGRKTMVDVVRETPGKYLYHWLWVEELAIWMTYAAFWWPGRTRCR
jgi:hypothetical protein